MKLKHLESVNNNNCLKKLFAFVLFVVLFFAVSQSAEAASRYWVGGTGTWDQSTTTHWSASSGGSGGASVPTASDDVFIDSSSGSGTITVSATAPMLSLDFTGYTGTFAGSAATTISGSLTLGAGMTLTYTGNITFNATSGSRTITSNGKSLASSVTFNGTGGTWAIQDTFVTTQGIVLVAGTLNLNNFNTTSSSFVGTGTGVRTLTMGSGTWTLSGSGIVWDIENASVTPDITFNANTSTIKVTNTSGAVTFRGGSHTYNKLWFSKGADTNSITITGSANTFGELKDDGTAAHSLFFGFNSTTTISTWNISGTPGNLITISSSDGSTGVHLLVKVGSYVDADYLNIQHSAASPVGRWFAGTHSVDNQAVATAGSGWAFTVPDTTAPVIAEVTPVSSPTADATPNYTFSSTEAGTISYGGSCSSATTSAASGNNTITFSFLSDGTYSNCTITVTDPTGNASNVLSVSSFTVSAAPILAEVIPIPPTTSDTTPNYTFSSTEAGTISYGGSCSSATTSAASGNNTITFSTLADGVYSNCTITVTDGNSMASDPLAVDSFTVDTIPDTTSILYGIDGSGQNPDPPHLYILNTTTGQKQTDVGAVGFYVTGMAFHPDTNVLYGSTGNTGSNTKSLITINKDTGAGTLLGALKDGSNGTHTLADIEFRSNGTLYGWSTNGNDLYTVDLTSCNGTSDTNCLVTKVGEFGSSAFGNGLVFDTNDNLYLFRQGDDNFNTLDPDTGLSIEQTNFSNPSGNGYTIPAATINGDGVIYAPRLNYGSSPSDLITIAMDTGTITSLGDTADMLYMDALAFYFPPDTTAPAISAISVTATQSTATITWTTDESSSSSVQYGLTTSYGSSGTGSGSTTSHSVTLTSLAACTTYNYKAVSVDSASNSGESSNQTVTTSGCTSSVSGSVARSAVSPVVPFIPTTPTSTPTPSPAAPVVFTRALVLGKKDPAVKKLQQYLNAHSFTISRVGAGSPGKETDFFGIKTKAALIRFQEAHAADILIPLGLKKGTGNLGPRTRAYIATHP